MVSPVVRAGNMAGSRMDVSVSLKLILTQERLPAAGNSSNRPGYLCGEHTTLVLHIGTDVIQNAVGYARVHDQLG